MPELPEVQNTVEGIRQHVIGSIITDVWTDYDSPAYYGKENIKDPQYFQEFKQQVIGCTITAVERRAKQIFIHLDSGSIIAVHMKMTGHFLIGSWDWNNNKWQPPSGFWNKTWEITREEVKKTMPLSDPFNDFIHVMFQLDDGRQLAFSDMRKFGTLFIINDPEQYRAIDSMYGPEPLDRSTTLERFTIRMLTRPGMMIKPALLDQSLIAGFGNIYTDEVLWAAHIHPESLVGNLGPSQWKSIYREGKKILRTAIQHGGDSMGDYRRIDGTGGTYQGMHEVYKQEGAACSRCNAVIEKKQIGQRVGRFCARCQVLY